MTNSKRDVGIDAQTGEEIVPMVNKLIPNGTYGVKIIELGPAKVGHLSDLVYTPIRTHHSGTHKDLWSYEPGHALAYMGELLIGKFVTVIVTTVEYEGQKRNSARIDWKSGIHKGERDSE